MPVDANDPRLETVTSASLTDAMDQLFDHTAHLVDLVSPTPDRHLFGYACTIRFVPARSDLPAEHIEGFWDLLEDALGAIETDPVLVLDTSQRRQLAPVGGNKVTRFEVEGLAGLLADARLRDFDEIAELEPVCWCRGPSPKAGSGQLLPVAANVPAAIEGVTILPGDAIYADRFGTVVIPAGYVDEILDRAVDKERSDVEAQQAIRDGAG